MIGLDTNVVVRYIMQDDPRQSALATRLVELLTAATPGYVPLVSVTELSWVLLSAYGLERSQLVQRWKACFARRKLSSNRRRLSGRRFGCSRAAVQTLQTA